MSTKSNENVRIRVRRFKTETKIFATYINMKLLKPFLDALQEAGLLLDCQELPGNRVCITLVVLAPKFARKKDEFILSVKSEIFCYTCAYNRQFVPFIQQFFKFLVDRNCRISYSLQVIENKITCSVIIFKLVKGDFREFLELI